MDNLVRPDRVRVPHADEKKRDWYKQRENEPERALYRTRSWIRLSKLIRILNPVCQNIRRDGLYFDEQCHNASTLVHHRVSPRQDPKLFFEPTNLVALCDACHTDSEGDPKGVKYVATNLPKVKV